MANKSWHLDRRTFLLGTGVSLALPWLECMAGDKTAQADTPRRMCAMYFGFGVSLPKEDSDQAMWRWFPKGGGRAYKLTETLKPLESLREAQLDIYRNPGMIEEWAKSKSRGFNIGKRIEAKRTEPSNTTPPHYWAAFQLSGPGN